MFLPSQSRYETLDDVPGSCSGFVEDVVFDGADVGDGVVGCVVGAAVVGIVDGRGAIGGSVSMLAGAVVASVVGAAVACEVGEAYVVVPV